MANEENAVNGTAEEPEKTEETVKSADVPDEDTPLKPAAKGKKGGKKKGKKGKKGKTEAADKEGEAAEATEEVKKKKPVKKVIPHWATLSDAQAKQTSSARVGPTATSSVTTIIEAINDTCDGKGLASYILVKKHVQKHHPSWPKMTFKSALRNAVAKGRVKQIRNSYKVVANPKGAKSVEVKKKVSSKGRSKTVKVVKEGPLEELFPHIFTWVCEPKEASYGLIRKYIGQHFPNLSTDAPFKKAMETMENKGQLDRLTGKGANGTFQLMDGAKKTGAKYEDPIEDAIIASNEPKDASIPALRHYLSEYHTEYDVANKPKVLLKALERAEAQGWVKRITGAGFSGSFRLGYPYIPSPKDLWREAYNENDYEVRPRTKSVKYADDSDEEEEESEESEDEYEDTSDEASVASEADSYLEVIPKKKKRGAPTVRGEPVKKKAKKPAPAKKPAGQKKKQPAKPSKASKAKKTANKKKAKKRNRWKT